VNEDIPYKEIAMLNRALMADVWRKIDANEDLSPEEELLAEQLQAHPEFSYVWENDEMLEHAFDPEREENPFLHISLHVMLERQINMAEPPCVRQAVERLEARGEDPHEVRHAILRVFVEELWTLLARKERFDVERYHDRIEKL